MSRGIALGAGAAAALAATAATLVIGLNSTIIDRPALFVTLRVAVCVGLVAVALAVGVRGGSGRMAAILVASASVLALGGLTGSAARIPFALGRMASALSVLVVVYTSFAYPSGRIDDRAARRLLGVFAAGTGVLLAANMLLSDVPPVAGPFVRCAGTACPSNPLNVITVSAGWSNALSIALALLTGLALAATAALLARRAARDTPLQRHSVMPLLVWAGTAALGYGFFVTVRAVDEHAALLTPAAIVVAAIVAAMPVALALAIARGRVFALAAVEHLVAELESHSSLAGLEHIMARAFGDPQLQVALWHPAEGQYVDVDGQPLDSAVVAPHRSVARVRRGADNLALIVHDPVLPADVIETAASAIRLALDNAQLHVSLSASIRALEASRKRVTRAADEERQRIERDLHDGAQQGLIDLRIRLQLLEELADQDPGAVGPGLADAGRRVQAALDDIRDLAHGIYPSALTDLGLPYALADVTRTLPGHVALHVDLPRRPEPEVETAVYFCCVEALQNVAKHCRADTAATLSLSEAPDGLHFVLTDSGPGFDPARATPARGLTGMRDRLEAIGGRLTVRAASGEGCQVSGHVPLRTGSITSLS